MVNQLECLLFHHHPFVWKLDALNNTSERNVAPWCYKWMDWMGWISPGGVRYRAPYSDKNDRRDSGGTLWQKNTKRQQTRKWRKRREERESSESSLHLCIDAIIYNWPYNYIYRHKCSNFFMSVRRFCEKVVIGRLQELLSELINQDHQGQLCVCGQKGTE